MSSDRLIAVSQAIPRDAANAIALGALRRTDEPASEWVREARAAIRSHHRVLLSGDIHELGGISSQLKELARDTSQARFAALLHWRQVLKRSIPLDVRVFFETVYVAVDEELDAATVRQIESRCNPSWVLVPTNKMNWSKWIPSVLFPEKKGRVLILALRDRGLESKTEGLSADELRLKIDEFTFDHPLLKIESAPPEWFVPSELGPWKIRDRDDTRCSIVYDGRTYSKYSITFVVPHQWHNSPESIDRLKACLRSILEVYPRPGECEILLAVDHPIGTKLTRDIVPAEISEYALVSVPRTGSADDWRAGFVRNVGASFASPVETAPGISDDRLVFIDSDAAITEPIQFRHDLESQSADLWMLADRPDELGFQTATTMLLAIRRSLFKEIDGFANAFSSYGCEDNFLVWRAIERGARLGQIARTRVTHLRKTLETDDLIIKLDRLRTSADLMYRMTLDPSVHRHFFASLGSSVWFRGALKRAMEYPASRAILAPLVFLLTLLETESVLTYLKSFWDVGIWKVKRPALWIASNKWRAGEFKHFWREHAWKIPAYFKGAWARLLGNTKRLFGNLKKHSVVVVREPAIRISKTLKWKLIVLTIRVRGTSRKIVVNYVTVPLKKNISGNVWRLPIALGRVRGAVVRYLVEAYTRIERMLAETWIFQEPSAWFALRTPRFYHWVWRPLLKARYFLEYHLVQRWKSS